MPNGGMSRREREREKEEREISLETFTDSETGQTAIIPDKYNTDSELIDMLIKAGINPKTAIRSDLVILDAKNQQSNLIDSGFRLRMLSGDKILLSKNINKIEGEKVLQQVIKKTSKYSAIATAIPTLGISTAIGGIIGGSVALIEIFTQKDKKTAKTIIKDFLKTIFDSNNIATKKVTQNHKINFVKNIVYKEDINSLIDLIKTSFENTPLEKACNSLYLSDKSFSLIDNKNILQFKVNINPKPIDKLNIKKLAYIAGGLLLLRFLIFKG